MNETQRKERNEQRLSQLYQPFAAQIRGVIADLEAAGYRPRIQEAYRSPADQLKAYNSGYSKLKYGFHNVTRADGTPEGLAVDLYDDDRPLNPTTAYLLRLSAAAWAHDMATGVLWGLTSRQRQLVTDTIKAGAWEKDVQTGWDAWHIEPTGLTPQQARTGKRPAYGASPKPPASPALPPPVAQPYQVVFPNGETEAAPVRKDRAWLPLRVWGERIHQPVLWQGSDLPILLAGRPYTGEMEALDGVTYSPVRDLAAISGLDLTVDIPSRMIRLHD